MFCSITMHRQRRTCLNVKSSSGGDLFGLSLLPDYNKWYCWSKLEYVTHFWDLRNAPIYINVNLISYTPLITNSLSMRTKFETVHQWWKYICQVHIPVLTKYGCSYETRTTSLGSKMIWNLYLIFPIFLIFPSFFAIINRYLFPGQSRCLTGTPPQETRASGHIMKPIIIIDSAMSCSIYETDVLHVHASFYSSINSSKVAGMWMYNANLLSPQFAKERKSCAMTTLIA